ncbi:MAG: uracil-DNA glycosylase, partial [Bryobacteraceae bacterium]|nr:uracil-DNA glycosylase [Bryobacteraceae bacterium]
MGGDLRALQEEICNCLLCPRLREYCTQISTVKRRAYRNESYWGRPVPSFGDPDARVLVLGLAPGAHGANRTGRMFTGDSSGNLLYRVLWKTGFASQPTAQHRTDGLVLNDIWITASAHCAPPDNKPARDEVLNCRRYLIRELELLQNVRVIVALGRLAFDNYLDLLRVAGAITHKSGFVFGHGATARTAPGQPWLLASYHPSQQNTSTGKLTEAMLTQVFITARDLASQPVTAGSP